MLLSLLFTSCCTNVNKEKQDISNNKRIINNPAVVAINQSKIKAKVEEVLQNTDSSFVLKAFVSEVEENSAYPSLAVVGSTYILVPNFVLGEDKTIVRNEGKNRRLLQLTAKKPGDNFEAIISYENLKGWFIQEVISD